MASDWYANAIVIYILKNNNMLIQLTVGQLIDVNHKCFLRCCKVNNLLILLLFVFIKMGVDDTWTFIDCSVRKIRNVIPKHHYLVRM